jgi:hypothetical protein
VDAHPPSRAERILSRLLLALVTAQPLLGLARRDIYRDVEWITATWLGNDLVTLCVAAPVLALSSAGAARRSPRARLVWLGVVAYAAYNYAFYLLGAAMNAFFPIYVAAVLVSVVTLGVGLASTDVAVVARRCRRPGVARWIGGYYVFVACGLSLVWLGTWAAYIVAGRPTPIETEVFKLVAALDLTLLVPTLGAGGLLLWRRAAWGHVVAPLAGVQATLYLLVLAVNAGLFIVRGLTTAPGELPLWGALLVTTGAATAVLLGQYARADAALPGIAARVSDEIG